MYNGPLYVRGDLDIDGAESDMKGVRFRAALCRCGQSKNKPFCDNSHEEAGFKGLREPSANPATGSSREAEHSRLPRRRTGRFS